MTDQNPMELKRPNWTAKKYWETQASTEGDEILKVFEHMPGEDVMHAMQLASLPPSDAGMLSRLVRRSAAQAEQALKESEAARIPATSAETRPWSPYLGPEQRTQGTARLR